MTVIQYTIKFTELSKLVLSLYHLKD